MDFAGALERLARRRAMAAAAWIALCVAANGLCAVQGFAQKPTEFDVKAAYLFNFGKFLRQPDAGDAVRHANFDICVLGKDDFGGALNRLTANEQMNGVPERTIKVATAAAAKGCSILFISSSEADRLEQELSDLGSAPVLTVSDLPRFIERGGMIQFEMQDNHVRFSVGLDAVNRAGLGLSSELLKVSLQVTRGTKRGGL